MVFDSGTYELEPPKTALKSATASQTQLQENHKDCHNVEDPRNVEADSTKITFPCKGEDLDRLTETDPRN